MAKDDYFVIVYQVLSYLYNCLKNGIEPEKKDLIPEGKLYHINERYWNYIFVSLYKDGYIDGLNIVDVDNSQYARVVRLEGIFITPKGIAYLCDNSTLKKAKQFLKEIKELIPFT